MATDRIAVQTDVRREFGVSIIDINRTVALIADTATFADEFKLYTDLESVGLEFADTDEAYLLAERFFNQAGENGYLYLVPVRLLDGADPDIVGTLNQLQNNPALVWSVVVADTDTATSAQVLDGSLATALYNKPYHMLFETTDVATITAATTDPASVNKAIYDALTGDDALLEGNMSFIYTPTASDYQAAAIAGQFMKQDIGTQTAKFMIPLGSTAQVLTGAELAFAMQKNVNVYTGTNEQTGRSFLKEGVALKSGSYIGTSLGAIWIETNMNSNIYDLLQAKKVTIDDTGFTLLESAVTPIFTQGQTQGIIRSGTGQFTISFAAGALPREIVGTYTYNEGEAGHFITNNVTITQGE